QQGRPDPGRRRARAGRPDRVGAWLDRAVVHRLRPGPRGHARGDAAGAGVPGRAWSRRSRGCGRRRGRWPGRVLSRCAVRDRPGAPPAGACCPWQQAPGAGRRPCRRRLAIVARQQKTRPKPGFSRCLQPVAGQAAALSALIRAVRRLWCRAALFLWIRPRELKRSSSGWATAKAASAPAASLASSALITFFTAVRSCERWAVLRALRTTVCLARFWADLMLATMGSWKLVWN